MKYPRIAVIGLFAVLITQTALSVRAQTSSLTVATNFEIAGDDVEKGMLVSNDGNSVDLTAQKYDPNVFGVITENPAITLGRKEEVNTYPVATLGTVPVLVSSINGAVKKGDYVTSSEVPGIGMRATLPGRVIGRAVETFSSADAKDTGLVMTIVASENVTAGMLANVGALEGDIEDYESKVQKFMDKEQLLNYVKLISSGIIAVLAFAGGIMYYIQISKKEIEAIGRNPLASESIRHDMVKHGFVVVLICVGGLIMSYIILTF